MGMPPSRRPWRASSRAACRNSSMGGGYLVARLSARTAQLVRGVPAHPLYAYENPGLPGAERAGYSVGGCRGVGSAGMAPACPGGPPVEQERLAAALDQLLSLEVFEASVESRRLELLRKEA